ncbi:MAG TPA: O-antigen ligase family protein [Solirubrobacteraceae bacterium]|jgi:hypothetical protein|nr:O-antigen ligase family protein [Solirubrobacteraceae bacterium]
MSRLFYRGLLLALAYVLMVDGYLRLRTGSSHITLIRDVIPWGFSLIGVGVLSVRRQRPGKIPMLGLVLAFILLAIAEIFNPDTISPVLGVQALRQDLEFVPLFFISYAVMDTDRRLMGLAIVFVGAGVANGIISFVQSNLTPAQLSSWGPGFSSLYTASYINGIYHSAAVYISSSGSGAVRPSALGGDQGFGGVLGMCALPLAVALVVNARRPLHRWLAIASIPAIVVAVITSQTRAAVIGAVVALVVFLMFLAVHRRAVAGPLLAVVVVGLLLIGLGGYNLGRYATISPSHFASTFGSQRGASINLIPTYAVRFPFGAGLGTAGPASTLGASVNTGKFSGENGFTFLILELGLPGLLCVMALFGAALRRGTRVAVAPGSAESRLYLAALTAGLFGCAALWLSGGVTAAPPLSPFIWVALGTISAWSSRAWVRAGARGPAGARE